MNYAEQSPTLDEFVNASMPEQLVKIIHQTGHACNCEKSTGLCTLEGLKQAVQRATAKIRVPTVSQQCRLTEMRDRYHAREWLVISSGAPQHKTGRGWRSMSRSDLTSSTLTALGHRVIRSRSPCQGAPLSGAQGSRMALSALPRSHKQQSCALRFSLRRGAVPSSHACLSRRRDRCFRASVVAGLHSRQAACL